MSIAAPPPSRWDTAIDYAHQAEEILDAPVYDLAAILEVEAAWLGAILFATKMMASGLWMTFKKR